MKGLSIYLMAPLMEEEVVEDADYANAVENASSTTVRDIQNLYKRKASVPSSFANILVIIKLLEKSSTPSLVFIVHPSFVCPSISSPCLVNSATMPRINFWLVAERQSCGKSTRKSRFSAEGKLLMEGTVNDDLIPEWQVMETHLQVKSNFSMLVISQSIDGTTPTATMAYNKSGAEKKHEMDK